MSNEEFDILAREHREYLSTYLSNKHFPLEEIEDLVQEILIKAYQNRDSFRGEAKMRSWLVSIAHNTMIDWYRRNQKTQNMLSLDEPVGKYGTQFNGNEINITRGDLIEDKRMHANPHLKLETKEITCQRKEIIARTLAVMSEKLCSVLVLHINGYGQEQIAEELCIPVGTVKSRLSRALREFGKIAKDDLCKCGIADSTIGEKRRLLTAGEREEVYRLKRAGQSIYSIARQFNKTESAIRYMIQDAKRKGKL